MIASLGVWVKFLECSESWVWFFVCYWQSRYSEELALMYVWQADYDRARHYSTLATQQFLLVSYNTLVNIIKETTPVVLVYVKVCHVDSNFLQDANICFYSCQFKNHKKEKVKIALKLDEPNLNSKHKIMHQQKKIKQFCYPCSFRIGAAQTAWCQSVGGASSRDFSLWWNSRSSWASCPQRVSQTGNDAQNQQTDD